MELSAKTLWPLFPLLLLVVVICLTWAFVHVVRRFTVRSAVWYQGGALVAYILAAVSAVASEGGAVSANVHRPFSILTQILIVLSILRFHGTEYRQLVLLNIGALSAILADTALHYLLT